MSIRSLFGATVAAIATGVGFAVPAQAADSDAVSRGKYLAIVGGCNDCHTGGFPASGGAVPESQWLMGGPLGFRGPWGTTYAPNLRITVSRMTEAQWVVYAKNLKSRPPMPWFNLNQWTDADLAALYQYTKSLGAIGEPAPEFIPPEKTPNPPFVQWPMPPK